MTGSVIVVQFKLNRARRVTAIVDLARDVNLATTLFKMAFRDFYRLGIVKRKQDGDTEGRRAKYN